MNDSPDRDVALFTEALQLPIAERVAYLQKACGGDHQLRRRVEGLLESYERVGDFLEETPHHTILPSQSEAIATEQAGDSIGRYKLLQQIGEGGCGVVYMAEQAEPVRRRVALKIIKPGMDTKSVIARFEAERQALALMDHPNIAKIFDAGATESGRPYFVMELVRGVKITEYCDQHALMTEDRLRLFIQVCQAIQHAHQKGIIHRDIKPSNILVTTTLEGGSLPVVIDFGIAKATTNQRLTEKTLFTAFEMLIGTPAYMSPEQAELTSIDVDTRTDIYSLGVLLYELLTGLTPFDVQELSKVGLDEIRRVIRECEPVRPSTRLSRMTRADLTTVAQRRQAEAPSLIRVIRGDLDWIVMKALDKDRSRRYETASGLAMDVQRYLSKEPISARPPNALYKLLKMVLRNRLLFAGLGFIALLLISSLIAVSASLGKERHLRRMLEVALQQAEDERTKAETASVKSQQVTQFLKDMLSGVGPSVARGEDTTMLRGILDRTAERIGLEITNQPAVEADLRTLIGQLYFEVGKYSGAEQMHQAALTLNRKLVGPASPAAAASLNYLGLALDKQRNTSAAERAHREALQIRRQSFGDLHPDVATSLNNLATVLRHQKRLTEAEGSTREALAIRRKLFGTESLETADSLHNLCIVLGDEGKRAESEATARELLALRRRLLGNEHSLVASALADAAWAARGSGKLDDAEAFYREALKIQLKLLGEAHPDYTAIFHDLGSTLLDNGKLGELETLQREALNRSRKRVGDHDPQTLHLLSDLAATLERRGRWSEAAVSHQEALSGWRKQLGNGHPQTMYTLRSLGLAQEAAKVFHEAENTFREAWGISRKETAGDQGPEAVADLDRLSGVLVQEKKYREAGQLLNEVLTPGFIRQPACANLLIRRVDLLGRQGRWMEAIADAKLLLEYRPDDQYRYHMLAGLLAMTHERPAYEELCQKALKKFVQVNNPYVAERIAQDCLLLPQPAVDFAFLDKLADISVTTGAREVALPYFQACKAMSEYRRGHFAQATEWAEKVVKSSVINAQAKAYAVSAMAYWDLGQREVAQTILARGESLAPPISVGHDPVDLGELWLAWLFARITLDEATGLIHLDSRTDTRAP